MFPDLGGGGKECFWNRIRRLERTLHEGVCQMVEHQMIYLFIHYLRQSTLLVGLRSGQPNLPYSYSPSPANFSPKIILGLLRKWNSICTQYLILDQITNHLHSTTVPSIFNPSFVESERKILPRVSNLSSGEGQGERNLYMRTNQRLPNGCRNREGNMLYRERAIGTLRPDFETFP